MGYAHERRDWWQGCHTLLFSTHTWRLGSDSVGYLQFSLSRPNSQHVKSNHFHCDFSRNLKQKIADLLSDLADLAMYCEYHLAIYCEYHVATLTDGAFWREADAGEAGGGGATQQDGPMTLMVVRRGGHWRNTQNATQTPSDEWVNTTVLTEIISSCFRTRTHASVQILRKCLHPPIVTTSAK